MLTEGFSTTTKKSKTNYLKSKKIEYLIPLTFIEENRIFDSFDFYRRRKRSIESEI